MLMRNTAVAALAVMPLLQPTTPGGPERRTCKAAGGVPIVYSVAGSGEPALVFIHGGFANRGFWDEQIKALERPEEFDGHVRDVVAALVRHAADGAPLRLAGALQ
jgi:hypothetical protein